MQIDATAWLVENTGIPFIDIYAYPTDELARHIERYRDITGNLIPIHLGVGIRDLYKQALTEENLSVLDHKFLHDRMRFWVERVKQWMFEQNEYEKQFLSTVTIPVKRDWYNEYLEICEAYLGVLKQLPPSQYNLSHTLFNQYMKNPDRNILDATFSWRHNEETSSLFHDEPLPTEYVKMMRSLTNFETAIEFVKMFNHTRQDIVASGDHIDDEEKMTLEDGDDEDGEAKRKRGRK